MSDVGALARESTVVQTCGGRESLLVTGPERLTWLDGLLTCEVKGLGEGGGAWGLSLTRHGKIQSDVWLVAQADRLWVSLSASAAREVHAELDRMLIMEDAELGLRERELSWFRLHGPLSASRAQSLATEHGGLSAAIDWLGLGGAALAVPLDAASRVASAAGDSMLTDADWLRLRLERGFPEIGTDYSQRDRPHEAGLERRAVSWSKGCYLGQEVVCMQDMRGKVRRSNRVLAVSADPGASLAPGQSVVGATGEACGAISATIHSPRAGAWLAMCRVELSVLGGELFVQTASERHPATLAEPV